MFAGIYTAEHIGAAPPDWLDPLHQVVAGITLTADTLDQYRTALTSHLEPYIGRLWIEWGAGARKWVQRPDRQNARSDRRGQAGPISGGLDALIILEGRSVVAPQAIRRAPRRRLGLVPQEANIGRVKPGFFQKIGEQQHLQKLVARVVVEHRSVAHIIRDRIERLVPAVVLHLEEIGTLGCCLCEKPRAKRMA